MSENMDSASNEEQPIEEPNVENDNVENNEHQENAVAEENEDGENLDFVNIGNESDPCCKTHKGNAYFDDDDRALFDAVKKSCDCWRNSPNYLENSVDTYYDQLNYQAILDFELQNKTECNNTTKDFRPFETRPEFDLSTLELHTILEAYSKRFPSTAQPYPLDMPSTSHCTKLNMPPPSYYKSGNKPKAPIDLFQPSTSRNTTINMPPDSFWEESYISLFDRGSSSSDSSLYIEYCSSNSAIKSSTKPYPGIIIRDYDPNATVERKKRSNVQIEKECIYSMEKFVKERKKYEKNFWLETVEDTSSQGDSLSVSTSHKSGTYETEDQSSSTSYQSLLNAEPNLITNREVSTVASNNPSSGYPSTVSSSSSYSKSSCTTSQSTNKQTDSTTTPKRQSRQRTTRNSARCSRLRLGSSKSQLKDNKTPHKSPSRKRRR